MITFDIPIVSYIATSIASAWLCSLINSLVIIGVITNNLITCTCIVYCTYPKCLNRLTDVNNIAVGLARLRDDRSLAEWRAPCNHYYYYYYYYYR